MGIQSYSTTAASNNSASPNGAPEGMAPSGVNDTIRQIMADIRTWYETAQWLNLGYTHTYVGATQFKISGTDVTAIYPVGRRVRAVGSSTGTIYGTITVSSFSTDTTITVSWASGSLSNESLTVSAGILTPTNNALPAISGTWTINGTSATAGGIVLGEDTDNGTNTTTLKGAASMAGDRTITLPDATTTVVGTDTTDTLTNKTLSDSSCVFADDGDATKKLAFQCSGITTATTRTVTIPNKSGTMAMTSDISSVTAQSTPANPTSTTSATQVMMGLAGSITPTVSGKILIIISGAINNSSGNVNNTVQIRYGTGSAPSNGDAATGTAVGAARISSNANGGTPDAFTVNAVVTGLTPSTTYWIDLGAACASGTLSIQTVSISAVEI